MNYSRDLSASTIQRQRSQSGQRDLRSQAKASSKEKAGNERTEGHKPSMVRWAGSRQTTQSLPQRPVSDFLVYFIIIQLALANGKPDNMKFCRKQESINF